MLDLAQGHTPRRAASPLQQVFVDEAGLGHSKNRVQPLHNGIVVAFSRFQNQRDLVDLQDLGNFAAQIAQEDFEIGRVEQPQDGPMDLVHPGEVFIGGGNHRAMRVFEAVETIFKPLHRDAAQIDDIFAHRLFIGRDQRLHDRTVVEDGFGVRDNLVAQGIVYCRAAAHGASALFLYGSRAPAAHSVLFVSVFGSVSVNLHAGQLLIRGRP